MRRKLPAFSWGGIVSGSSTACQPEFSRGSAATLSDEIAHRNYKTLAIILGRISAREFDYESRTMLGFVG